MKMLKNLTAAKLNFAMRTTAATIGAQIRRNSPRQSVPRGWIGSYSRSIPAIVPVSVAYPLPSGRQTGSGLANGNNVTHLVILRPAALDATIVGVDSAGDPVIYRAEVMAIIGAMADLAVEVRRIRELLEDEEEDE